MHRNCFITTLFLVGDSIEMNMMGCCVVVCFHPNCLFGSSPKNFQIFFRIQKDKLRLVSVPLMLSMKQIVNCVFALLLPLAPRRQPACLPNNSSLSYFVHTMPRLIFAPQIVIIQLIDFFYFCRNIVI